MTDQTTDPAPGAKPTRALKPVTGVSPGAPKTGITAKQKMATGAQSAGVTAPARKKSGAKKWLMLGIILTCVGLSAAIVVRVILNRKKGPPPRDVAAEIGEAVKKARNGKKDVFAIQSKAWVDGGVELTPEEIGKIKEGLKSFQDADAKMRELMELLQAHKKVESKEGNEIIRTWVIIKLWVLDADDLLDETSKPPEYGGLYIPMYRMVDKWRQASKTLKGIEGEKDALLLGTPEQKEEIRKKIKSIEEICVGAIEKFGALEDYVKKGLDRPDITVDALQELGDLREESNQAGMAQKAARELRSQFRD